MGPGVNVNWVPGITLEEMEKNCILAAFRFYRENKTQTAGALGISIRTLDSKLEKYAADRKSEQDRTADRKRTDAETLARFRGPQLTKQFSTGSSSQWAHEPADGANAVGEENDGAGNEANGETGDATSSGVRVEPASKTGTEHPLPVSQRKEVQGVLPRHASANSGGKRR